MCEFFSFVTDGSNNLYYFDSEIRKKIVIGELDYETDSHSSICHYFKLKEDKTNKYEYRPLTRELKEDQINIKQNFAVAKLKVEKLDFSKIVPELIIKPIIDPFNDVSFDRDVSSEDIALLRAWNDIMASVMDSVWDSVRDSVGDSVRYSVWYSVWYSVMDSVRDSVRTYTGSFFNLKSWKYIKHKDGEYPFQPLVDLWERGLVPSFDGTTWRLHAGKKAKIVFEINKDEL